MKLFENMEEFGGSITDAIKQMVIDMFQEELDDDQIVEIVKTLGLSDMLELDRAYSAGDRDTIKEILGLDMQLEYSMGGRGDINSAASTRQAPARRDTSSVAKSSSKDSKSNGHYSGGIQNGVSTKNIDHEDDDEMSASDEEEIEESKGKRCGKCGKNTIVHTKKGWYCSNCDDKMKKHMEESGLDYNPARGGYNSDNDDIELNSDEVIRTLLQVADDEELASLERLANRITQSYPDSVTIPQIMGILNEPQMRGVRKDDVEYALQAAGFIDFLESVVSEEYCSYCKGGTDENVQHCPECGGTGEVDNDELDESLSELRRRAGLA